MQNFLLAAIWTLNPVWLACLGVYYVGRVVQVCSTNVLTWPRRRNNASYYITVGSSGFTNPCLPLPTDGIGGITTPIARTKLICSGGIWIKTGSIQINPLIPELNPICYLLALLGAHHFLHVSRIRVKLLTFRLLMSYIYGAPILDVSRSHTMTQHSR